MADSDLQTSSSVCFSQLEDPAIRWQMALYRDLPNRNEETSDPEKTVERVLDIAHVLFHLDQVCKHSTLLGLAYHTHSIQKHMCRLLEMCYLVGLHVKVTC